VLDLQSFGMELGYITCLQYLIENGRKELALNVGKNKQISL